MPTFQDEIFSFEACQPERLASSLKFAALGILAHEMPL